MGRGGSPPRANRVEVAVLHHHKPDRDWDSVRVQALKSMSEHCSQRRWDWHPGATRVYQGYHNSGYIGRLSLRHVASGCDGA
jgi:hypothetical protein